MDEPPGSLDDLQPQDLSAAVDLARRGEAPPLAAAHMAKSPRWFPANAGNGRAGLAALADAAASSDGAGVGVRPGDPVQSDNAFSNTTVTLSYVSRSRVFPSLSQDAMSTHSSLYGVPSSIGKFSLQSSREAENGLGEALSQHYLQHADGPGLDRAARTQLFQALAQAQVQVGAETNDSHGLNGGLACGEGRAAADARVRGGLFESGFSRDPESGSSSPDAGEPQGGGRLGSGEVFQEPSAVGDGPVHYSGSATPLDRVSVPCPQASRPPGAVNSCPEAAADEVIWDGLYTENPIDPFPSEQAESSGDCTVPRLDAGAEPTAPARKRKAAPARKRKAGAAADG
ncbi:hypothetical protein N1851_012193 [Merluccius polli]|uniref:Uncharacterized protein n=1 Tax=Merluccius polli TaxID=89951 RepID=A0AA47P593_MERPO|nr:hypothetical protein N1851_012193 [Merluccius polli]